MRIMGFLVTALSILTVLICAGTTAAETLTLGEGLKLVTEKGRLVRIAAQDETIAKDLYKKVVESILQEDQQ